ncbi:MAG: caspase family protein [Alphaproteobacteria bacterium]|nr:caspase family protein [Alphaproteobacteria bacterium]
MRAAWKIGLTGAALLGGMLALTGWMGDANAAMRRANHAFSENRWEALLASEARMSITGQDPVQERRSLFDADKQVYTEAMRLTGGNMLYEWRKGSSVQENGTVQSELIKRYGSLAELKAMGVTIDAPAVRVIETPSGSAAIALVNGASNRCFFFFMFATSGDSAKDANQSQALTGGRCVPANASAAQSLELEFGDLLSRVRFDGGAYARSQMFAAGLAQARRREIEDEAAAAADSTPPTVSVPAQMTVSEPSVTIEGTASDDVELAEVKVNGRWAVVGPDGKFRITLPAPAGVSRVNVVALDRAGNRTERIVTVSNSGPGPGLAPVQKVKFGHYYALVIAEQNYLDSKLNLDNTINDGRLVANVLQQRYGFNVQLLFDARKGEIIDAFTDLARRLGPDDNLLIYYAGHGIVDDQSPKKPGYWVPIDGNGADSGNWLPNKVVNRVLRAINAQSVLVVSDSCFSGSLTQERSLIDKREYLHLRDVIRLRSRTAFSSGGLEEVVDVFAVGDKNSIFAQHFAAVLNANPAVMSGIQIAKLVQRRVHQQVTQMPQYGAVLTAGHDEGADFFFRTIPAPPKG